MRACKIYTFVSKVRGGFMGWVKVYDDGRYLYSQKTRIHRLTQADAKHDAIDLKQSFLELVA